MAILANAAYTLADWRAATNTDGTIADVINLLSQDNEALLDIPWMEANSGMIHKTTVRTSLGAGTFRSFNAGVPRSKNTSAPIEETCAMLEDYSFVDRDLANLNGNSAQWRLQEDKGTIDGFNQQMASYLFYSNAATTPAAFTGLAPRFSTVNTATKSLAANVMDAGGTGSNNASMWLVGWGPNTVHGIYPKGSKAGLQVNDVTTNAPVYDAVGNPYQALQTHYKWDCGIAVRDWRFVVRIANIDTTLLNGGSAAPLFGLLIAACNKVPVAPKGMSSVNGTTEASGLPVMSPRWAIYTNRTVKTAMEVQALNKSNGLIKMDEYAGMPITTFRGIPVRNMDALLNTEARVV